MPSFLFELSGEHGTMCTAEAIKCMEAETDGFTVEGQGPGYVIGSFDDRFMDGIADRQLQVEVERQQKKAKLRDQLAVCIGDAVEVKKSELVKLIMEKWGTSQAQAYRLFEKAERLHVLVSNDKRLFSLA